jgi:hypothetical protein
VGPGSLAFASDGHATEVPKKLIWGRLTLSLVGLPHLAGSRCTPEDPRPRYVQSNSRNDNGLRNRGDNQMKCVTGQ